MNEPTMPEIIPSEHVLSSAKPLEELTPFEMLKARVYPVLNQVILKLIDHIVKSQEVTKHEERLKKKKIVDQLEKKYLERDIERQEMGSDYEESDDQEYHKVLNMKKEAVETMIRKRIAKHKNNKLDDESDAQIQANIFNPINFIIQELKQHQKK